MLGSVAANESLIMAVPTAPPADGWGKELGRNSLMLHLAGWQGRGPMRLFHFPLSLLKSLPLVCTEKEG